MRTCSAPLLPYELLGHIADYMEYSEVQSLRLVSQHFCSALQHRALSRLNLDWHTSSCGRNHQFPVEKVQAYTKPGATPGFYHVRHLSINNICMDLKFCDTPFDRLLRLPDYYDHDYMTKREAMRTQLFYDLVEQLFKSDSMRRIRTMSWNMSCLTHKYNSNPCVEMVNKICNLISLRRQAPLERLDLILESQVSLFRMQNLGSVDIPASKTLVVVDQFSQSKPSPAGSQWIKSFIVNQPSLEYIDMNLVYDHALFAELFPNKGHSSRSFPQIMGLKICTPSFNIQPHVFRHFRHLRCLTFQQHSNIRPGTYETFWQNMLDEQIFVERLAYPSAGVDEAFLAYLAAYPKPSLAYLNLEYERTYTNESVNAFFTKALPVIAPGLEELHMPRYPVKHTWCHDARVDSLTPYQQCTSLQRLTIQVLHPSKLSIQPFMDSLIHQVFRGHKHLKVVDILVIISWSPLKFKDHQVQFVPDFQTAGASHVFAPINTPSERQAIPTRSQPANPSRW